MMVMNCIKSAPISTILVQRDQWQRDMGKEAFAPGGTWQREAFGLNIPKIHEAVHTGCKSFKSWHSNVGTYTY